MTSASVRKSPPDCPEFSAPVAVFSWLAAGFAHTALRPIAMLNIRAVLKQTSLPITASQQDKWSRSRCIRTLSLSNVPFLAHWFLLGPGQRLSHFFQQRVPRKWLLQHHEPLRAPIFLQSGISRVSRHEQDLQIWTFALQVRGQVR